LPTLEELDALNAEPEAPPPVAAPSAAPSLAELDALNAAPESPVDAPAAPEGPVLDKSGRVYVRDETGALAGTVDQSELGRLPVGYSAAAKSDVQGALDAQEYGDVGSQVAAGAEGLAQGATLGLYGLGADAVAGPEYAAERAKREKYNPTTATAANVVGGVGAVMLSGGTGALAKGAAYAPAALANAVGETAAKAVVKKYGTGIMAKALAGAAEAAADGAVSQAFMEVAKRAPTVVEDPDKWGEQLAAGLGDVGTTALLSGGIGSILGGFGGVLSKGSKSIDEHIAARKAAQAVEAPTPAQLAAKGDWESAAGDLTATVKGPDGMDLLDADGAVQYQRPLVSSVVDPDDTRSQTMKLLENVRAAEGGFEEAQQAAVLDGVAAGNQLLKDLNYIDTKAGLAAKTAGTKALPDAQVGFRVDPSEAHQYIDDVVSGIDSLKSDVGEAALQSGGGATALAMVKKQAAHSRKKIAEYAETGNLGAMHDELAQFTRTAGQASGTRNKLAQGFLRDHYDHALKPYLADEASWGSMGARQKAINPTWSERIKRWQADQLQGFFIKKSGEAASDPFEQQAAFNGEAFGSFINSLGDVAQDQKEQTLRHALRSAVADATNRANAIGGPEAIARAASVTAAAAKMEDIITNMKRLAVAKVAGQRQLKRTAGSELLGATVGTALPGAGFALGVMSGLKVKLLKAAASHGESVQGGLDAAVAQLARGAKSALSAGESAVRVAQEAAPKAVVSLLSARKFSMAISQATKLSDPNSDESLNLTDDADALNEISPGLGDSYANTQRARAAFLSSKMPPAVAAGVFGEAPRMDPVTTRKLERYAAAAYEPTKALARIASGHGSQQDLEAIKTLYPAMYKDFQARASEQLSKLKKAPHYLERVRLARITGLAMDYSTDPGNAAKLQQLADSAAADAIAEQQRGQENPGKDYRPNDADSVYASRTDSIIDGE
jgi:hypothetical protein